MKENFLTMENKDIPLAVGQRVRVVKALEIDDKSVSDFCSSKNMSSKATETYKKNLYSAFEKMNKKIEAGLCGRIVSNIMLDNFVVKMDEEDDCFQFNIDSVDLGKRQFFVLSKEHLLPLSEHGSLEGLALTIFQKKQGQTQNVLTEIKSVDNDLNRNIRELEEYKTRIESILQNVSLAKNKKTGLLAKLGESEFDTSLLQKQLTKISANPKIKKIEAYENGGQKYLLVETNELEYRSPRVIYNQGRFVFSFDLVNNQIKVYGSRYYRSNCNPCVSGDSNVCFGEDTNKYNKMLQQGEIIPLILAMINFLEEPNYSSPHCQDYDTFFGQELKIPANLDLNVLSNYVVKNSQFLDVVRRNWDDALFAKEQEKKVGARVHRIRETGSRPRTPINALEDLLEVAESASND